MDDFTVRDAVDLAITTEQIGAKLYDRMAKKFEDVKELNEIFDRLRKDELIHEAQFKNLLEVLPAIGESEKARYGVDEYLKATAISEFFSKDAFERLADFTMPEEALQNAFKLEKNTLLFYQALEESVGKHEVLEEIIKTEKDHVVSLMKVIMTDAKFRGLGDKGP